MSNVKTKSATTQASEEQVPPILPCMSLSEALNQINQWQRTINAFVRVSDVASAVAGFEQNRTEREALLAQLATQIELKQSELAEIQANALAVAAKASAQGDNTRADCAAMLNDARANAKAIIEAAQASANQINANAEAVHKDYSDKILAISAAKQELAAITQRIEDAKEAARKTFGG